jgi:hypothetical protein
MSLHWDTRPRDVFRDGAANYAIAIRRAVRQLAERYAVEIEQHMKDTAPWTDRSSNARQTLTARVEDAVTDMIEIQLRYGVDYGIYLELANGGRYAIINPSIDLYGPQIWNDVRALLR